MTDEPTRRMFPEHNAAQGLPHPSSANETATGYSTVPERPSTRPDTFSEREQPTLASPNSMVVSSPVSTEDRMNSVSDRVRQLETDLENVYAQLEHLSDALNTEQLRARSARMGRYLIWGALIAAMATFWMLLRLRAGLS